MWIHRPSALLGALSLLSCLALGRPASAESPAAPQLRLPFIANEGQVTAEVAYYAPTSTGTVFVTVSGQLVYDLSADAGREARNGGSLTERFIGGSARPLGQERSDTRVSYFLGRDSRRWRP